MLTKQHCRALSSAIHLEALPGLRSLAKARLSEAAQGIVVLSRRRRRWKTLSATWILSLKFSLPSLGFTCCSGTWDDCDRNVLSSGNIYLIYLGRFRHREPRDWCTPPGTTRLCCHTLNPLPCLIFQLAHHSEPYGCSPHRY